MASTNHGGTLPAASLASPSSTTRLIPDGVYDYAKRLSEGTLADDPFPSGHAPNDEKLLPFLTTVTTGDEDQALRVLAFILEGAPLRLWHPYVQSVFMHLFFYCWNSDAPQDFRDRINTVLGRLIEAWARGITGGYDVSVIKPKGRRGQSPALFPHLLERDGYMASRRAQEESEAADRLVRFYEDLMTRLQRGVQWKAVRNEYRAYTRGERDPTPVIEDTASTIRPIVDGFCHDWHTTGRLTDERLKQIVAEGLAVPTGRDPRHKIACGLIAQWELKIGGVWRRATPGLVESTLETLSRHGLRPRKGSGAAKSRATRYL